MLLCSKKATNISPGRKRERDLSGWNPENALIGHQRCNEYISRARIFMSPFPVFFLKASSLFCEKNSCGRNLFITFPARRRSVSGLRFLTRPEICKASNLTSECINGSSKRIGLHQLVGGSNGYTQVTSVIQ